MADIIVAIELGSSKITGVAGRKNLDGSINVLSLVSEDSTSCIRKGVVYNIDKTGQALSNIINKLEQSLPLPTWRSGRYESEEVPQRNYAGDTGAYPQPPQGV